MTKPVRYIVAVVSIIFLYFLVFGVIGSLLGWQRGGGVIVILAFMAASVFIWKRITKIGDNK